MNSEARLGPEPVVNFTLAATAVSMVATPLLAAAARRLMPAAAAPPVIGQGLMIHPPGDERHTIVIGYGRTGKVVCALLKQHEVKFIAIDHDAVSVARDRKHGHPVYYGDAIRSAIPGGERTGVGDGRHHHHQCAKHD
jgi:CPA2 family monovalent cation:H+ antiporter-2